MGISQHFCDARQWAQPPLGGVPPGDVRRGRRACLLAAGWARPPRVGIPRLGTGSAHAGKAAGQRLGGEVVTPNALQGSSHRLVQLLQQAAPLLPADMTQLR